jgi:hypothetical protein
MNAGSRRRRFAGLSLVAVVVSLAAACAPVPNPAPSPGPERPTDLRPFSSSAWLYQQVRNPVSGMGDFTYGTEIAAEVVKYYGHVSVNTYQFAPTVYRVGAAQPTMTVTPYDCQGRGTIDPGFAEPMQSVPIPTDAVIPADADASVTVWQASTDTIWELWRARIVDSAWQACWGGRLDHASSNLGTFAAPYGATASGIPLLAGLVTPADLASGHIDHAIAIGVVKTRRGVISWPATRTDGTTSGATAIPEWQRLRLDPSIDLSKLDLSPLARMVAEAMQTYGVIVRDTSGSVSVYFESATPYRAAGLADPYVPYYGGKPKYAQFDGVPWGRLQALPLSYGMP